MSKRQTTEVAPLVPVLDQALIPLRAKLDAYHTIRDDAALALKERVEARLLQIVEARLGVMLDVLAD